MTRELDRRFRKVGRIKRAWGTAHAPTIRRMEEMLDVLMSMGRLDILRSLRDKEYTPLEVYSYYRVNNLEGLPTAATLAPLKSRMSSWIAKKECSEAHRRSLSQSLRHLLGTGQSKTSSVGALPSLLTALRDRFQGKHPRSWNLARAAAQAYLAETVGRNHTLYHAVQDLRPLKVTPQRLKHPLTPDELNEILKRMKGSYAVMAESMARTGMGPREYWGEWEIRGGDRVVIHGTKRSGRERVVPLFALVVAPTTEYAAFRRALRDASDPEVKPYDLRRTYANWLESAGIPRTRRKLYLGHGSTDVTSLYEWHEVTAFLKEDAEKLRAYVFGSSDTKLKLVEK